MKARFVLITLALAATGPVHTQISALDANPSGTTTSASLSQVSSVAVLGLPSIKTTAATPMTSTDDRDAATSNDPGNEAGAAADATTYALMALGLIGMGLVAHRRDT